MECRLAGETEVLRENLPHRHFCSSQNPTWPDPDLNPGRRGGKPSTNLLSYGAAFERLALSEGPNRVGVCPHLRTETDPVSETSCFFSSFNSLESGRWTKSENPLILCYTPSSEPYKIYLYVNLFIYGIW
jgi:hypothetical protein